MSLIVYGNTIWDNIYHVPKLDVGKNLRTTSYIGRAGGIANVCRATYGKCYTVAVGITGADTNAANYIKNITADVKSFQQAMCATSTATIIIDDESTRTSIVTPGACYQHQQKVIPLPHSSWIHIIYIDNLNMPVDVWAEFRKCADAENCIISTDISGHSIDGLSEKLQYVDYLFADREYEQTYTVDNVRAGVIYHNSTSILYQTKHKISEIAVTPVAGLNVLGAGDYLAGNCIWQLMRTPKLDLSLAHRTTLQLLHDQSNANQHSIANSRIRQAVC